LFSAALRAGTSHGLLWLVVVALFGSLISLYYYLVVLKVIFVDAAAETSLKSESYRIDLLQRGVIAMLAVAVLFLGIMPETLAARIIASLP
jgi:NADH-quinone oxidoreductase subunit N